MMEFENQEREIISQKGAPRGWPKTPFTYSFTWSLENALKPYLSGRRPRTFWKCVSSAASCQKPLLLECIGLGKQATPSALIAKAVIAFSTAHWTWFEGCGWLRWLCWWFGWWVGGRLGGWGAPDIMEEDESTRWLPGSFLEGFFGDSWWRTGLVFWASGRS